MFRFITKQVKADVLAINLFIKKQATYKNYNHTKAPTKDKVIRLNRNYKFTNNKVIRIFLLLVCDLN